MSEDYKIEINTGQFVKTIANAALGNGLVTSNEIDFIQEQRDKHLIVVAAAPRSGSTFLSNVLSKLTGFRYFRLCSAYSTNEHDMYLPALCLMNNYGCVSQMHMKGTFHNASLMLKFGIKPIILVRCIYDIIVSLSYDLRRKENLPHFGSGLNGYSFIWQDEQIKKLNDVELLNLIIDLIIPWYVNFYVSWYRLCEKGAVDAIWITYEKMMSNKEQTLKDIFDFIGIVDISDIPADLLGTKFSTFNDGRIGRGEEILTKAMKDRISRLFSYYSEIDFSMYGI